MDSDSKNRQNELGYIALSFPEAKVIVVSGDIHGDFNQLVYKLCVQNQMTDTLLIVAGDCGFGFEDRGYYENMVKLNAKHMNEANNWIVFIRGNHDNPAYFDGSTFKHKRFIAVSDYTTIQACSHTVLCVGGAISIDRQYRINTWKDKQRKFVTKESQTDALDRNLYWSNEAPLYDGNKMNLLCLKHAIDTVITHTAPSFCELFSKNGLQHWMQNDNTLLDDIEAERIAMDKLHEQLAKDNHPISHWFYGHFHQSWNSSIDGISFRMLDIMEFCTVC